MKVERLLKEFIGGLFSKSYYKLFKIILFYFSVNSTSVCSENRNKNKFYENPIQSLF